MKKSKYKIKVVCGFRKDQEHTIDANEAHKAYYLFNHPEQGGTFENGLALKGRDIQKIVPDYNATMGYNPTHVLTDDDYNEMNKDGVVAKLGNIMASAKLVAAEGKQEHLRLPLYDVVKSNQVPLADRTGSKFAQEVLAAPKK